MDDVKISLAFDVPCFGIGCIWTPVQVRVGLGETKEEAISTVYCIAGAVWQLQVTDRYKEENGRRSWVFFS
jgi:hypothetical protein